VNREKPVNGEWLTVNSKGKGAKACHSKRSEEPVFDLPSHDSRVTKPQILRRYAPQDDKQVKSVNGEQCYYRRKDNKFEEKKGE
jgi:hypothetical protein